MLDNLWKAEKGFVRNIQILRKYYILGTRYVRPINRPWNKKSKEKKSKKGAEAYLAKRTKKENRVLGEKNGEIEKKKTFLGQSKMGSTKDDLGLLT